MSDLIEKQREYDCKQESEHQVHQGHCQRISDASPEFQVTEQEPELIQPDEFRPGISLCRPVILESHDPSAQRVIGKNEGIDHIRLKCTSTVDNQDTINILKEYYRLDKGVKFQINKKSSNVINETQSSLYNQYDYLFNRSMSPYDILAKFINESQSDIMVTSDQIIGALKEI